MTSLLKRFKCNFAATSCLGSAAFFAMLSCFAAVASSAETGSVCFQNNCFHPEIARTQFEKQRGLMGRAALIEGQGMLFVYDQKVSPQFWMKNMRIPLDFIWLDEEGKTVALNENVPVCGENACPVIVSSGPIQYVLEIAAGSIQKSGIKIGDQAAIHTGEVH